MLCSAIIGGAVAPPLAGLLAQNTSYSAALLVPAICYGFLLVSAYSAGKSLVVRLEFKAAGPAH